MSVKGIKSARKKYVFNYPFVLTLTLLQDTDSNLKNLWDSFSDK